MISFASLKYGLIFLLMASKPAYSDDLDISKVKEIEGNLISMIGAHQKFLEEVKTSVDSLIVRVEKRFNEIEKNLIYTMKEIEGLQANLNGMNNSLLNTLVVKSESCNATGNWTDTDLEKRNSHFKFIQEVLNKKGKGKTCSDLTKVYLSGVSDYNRLKNDSENPDALSNFMSCWKHLPMSMEGRSYFVTPRMKGGEVASYCENHGGKPFIPKTQEEFVFYIEVTSMYMKGAWYPISDMKEEGHVVFHDGTDYENSTFKLEKWDKFPINTDEKDCVLISLIGQGRWNYCFTYVNYRILCQKN